jgi:D-alanyl-D-alanine dipeptidase
VLPVPPVSAAQAAVGLVDIRSAVPDAVIALAYASKDNWTKHRFYPADARCLVHKTMVPGLTHAAAVLRAQGYRLAMWDCYRPRAVQKAMFDIVKNADWVARPGPKGTQHEVGRAVDLTLAHADGTLVDMGSGYCNFTAISHSNAGAKEGLTPRQVANRKMLNKAMISDGSLWNYKGEWWHFNGPGSHTPRPHLDVPVD